MMVEELTEEELTRIAKAFCEGAETEEQMTKATGLSFERIQQILPELKEWKEFLTLAYSLPLTLRIRAWQGLIEAADMDYMRFPDPPSPHWERLPLVESVEPREWELVQGFYEAGLTSLDIIAEATGILPYKIYAVLAQLEFRAEFQEAVAMKELSSPKFLADMLGLNEPWLYQHMWKKLKRLGALEALSRC